MKRDIELTHVYRQPPEEVWRALTDSALIAEWLMPNDFVAKVGHRFTMHTQPRPGFDGVVHAEVRELDPPRRMRWGWKGGPLDTEVVFQLEALDAGGTRLTLRHIGFQGARGVMISYMLGKGWGTILGERLVALLARAAA